MQLRQLTAERTVCAERTVLLVAKGACQCGWFRTSVSELQRMLLVIVLLGAVECAVLHGKLG